MAISCVKENVTTDRAWDIQVDLHIIGRSDIQRSLGMAHVSIFLASHPLTSAYSIRC